MIGDLLVSWVNRTDASGFRHLLVFLDEVSIESLESYEAELKPADLPIVLDMDSDR